MATDQNWVFDHESYMDCYGNNNYNAKAMMNCGMPGTRIPGVLNWSVNETLDSVVQTATVEIANALPVSQITTQLTQTIPKQFHGTQVYKHYVKAPDGSTTSLDGNSPVSLYSTTSGGYLYNYQEDRVLYRQFSNEVLPTTGLSRFPDPAVPTDEDDANTFWESSAEGVGSYFIKVGDEVMRVHKKSGNNLYVPPGGRGINGIIQEHPAGSYIQLLGFGPFTGDWAGIGYLSTAESKPYKGLLRPGTCLASFEGYGQFPKYLTKRPWNKVSNRGYEFTGYWFVKGQEASIGEDGTPKTTIELVSCGYILTHQQITPNVVYRFRNQLVNWTNSAFDQAGIQRNIPGDWVDYQSWEPDRPNSYPIQIKTEYAQHKAFFDHMSESDNGKNCEFCQQEWLEYVNRPGYVQGSNAIGEARAVGRHIYKESIRVYQGQGNHDAGPLRTYGKLMVALAKIAWETPIVGSPLAQRWTKIPTNLWDNMQQFDNGMVWNGQLSFTFASETHDSKGHSTYPINLKVAQSDDIPASYYREPFMCPFESSYDKQDWYQPIQDLADMNRMTFQFNRRGMPIFIPRGMNLRGVFDRRDDEMKNLEVSQRNLGHWFMGWGGSINSYSYNVDTDQVLTMVWVSGTDAFDSTFSVVAAGTTYKNDKLIWYSSQVGNKDALQYTGGVQQIDTLSLENLVLGLDWDTNPAAWSLKFDRTAGGEGISVVSKLPPTPTRTISITGDNDSESVKQLKRCWNFLVTRMYILDVIDADSGQKIQAYFANIDDDFDEQERQFVIKIQQFLNAQGVRSGVADGIWRPTVESVAMLAWANADSEGIKKDVWWYAMAGYDWTYYVAAITGLPIPQRKDQPTNAGDDPSWSIDQLALKTAISDWQTKYWKQAINVGNKAVDDSVQKAVVRNFSSAVADPRIQLGDIAYLTIPGYLDSNDAYGDNGNPADGFRNATYVTSISRTMDLTNGSYTATYSGYRYRADADLQMGRNSDNFFDGATN